MPRIDPQRALVLSVLDRLLDDDPGVTSEPASTRPVLREMKKAIRRDLEHLLNTRRRPTSWEEDFTELEDSILNYGIPDLSGANLASARAREAFLRLIESVLKRCEPRFSSVRVINQQEEEAVDRTLRFRIDAQLRAEPTPEPIAFDSQLEPVSRTLEVKGG